MTSPKSCVVIRLAIQLSGDAGFLGDDDFGGFDDIDFDVEIHRYRRDAE